YGAITYRRNGKAGVGAGGGAEALGRRAVAERLELSEPEQVGPLFERVAAAFGRVDVLVANAAATAFRPLLEQKPHNVRRTFAISVDAFVAAVQAAVPLMRGRAGRISAISGIDSALARPGQGVAGVAEAAVHSPAPAGPPT